MVHFSIPEGLWAVLPGAFLTNRIRLSLPVVKYGCYPKPAILGQDPIADKIVPDVHLWSEPASNQVRGIVGQNFIFGLISTARWLFA
jgi:hypothetical protein